MLKILQNTNNYFYYFLIPMLMLTVILSLISTKHTVTQNLSSSKDDNEVISKSALKTLVDDAANEKYLMDVLNGKPKLPTPKHPPKLIPAQEEMQMKANASFSTQSSAVTASECNYSGQTYMAGDIVKIQRGWVRCTPTYTFTQSGNQVGGLAWVSVQ